MPDRRQFLAGAGAGLILGPSLLRAQGMAGGWEVLSLSDGHLTLPADMVFGPMPQDALAPIRAELALAETLTPPCNVTVLRNEDRIVLIDVGSGTEFMPTAGKLPDALAEAGIDPYDVTDVILTHGHPDHIWGLVDDFDDLAFPEAAYHMGRTEFDYWTDAATVDTIGADRQSFAVGAERRLARIADRISLFEDGQEVLPGVGARATFGHTPGHMALQIGEGSDGLMVLGDCIGNDHVALLHPEWRSGSDQDPDQAVTTRVALLAELASSGMKVIGFHLTGDGVGRIEATTNTAYAFLPEE
ncbi:MBL fold metallo-hydrolase [Roseobacter sp. HKCCA0434]|uniref:MBL fold metallo-hydrolase n=1 Tax=Roseobacter sp. HKCCA0434 TaxID=3079297 RepID=UPI002905CC45|nr:MBL fold metallo-hydrolase [Roseobacter sp. HKCCA0434]